MDQLRFICHKVLANEWIQFLIALVTCPFFIVLWLWDDLKEGVADIKNEYAEFKRKRGD
jgi:hypothetical protein